jgi:hypothetical protein
MNQQTLTSVRDGIRDWLVGAVLLALLTLVASSLGPTPTSAMPEAAATRVPTPAPTSTCWITGDVVGDANPADIHTNFCKSRR